MPGQKVIEKDNRHSSASWRRNTRKGNNIKDKLICQPNNKVKGEKTTPHRRNPNVTITYQCTSTSTEGQVY